MWKLEVAEGHGPWLLSTDDFVGRQVWEFDPDLGTPEEHAEVEKAREKFSQNRFQVKASSDVLKNLQLIKENGIDLSLPSVRLGDREEITCEKAEMALRKAVRFTSALQARDGHWPFEFSALLFEQPFMVIALDITGTLNTILSAEHKREMVLYIYNHQNEDGGWGLHIESHSMMLCTALNYVSLRLLGEEPEGGKDGAVAKARKWILDHGGVTMISIWGKYFLSFIGLYEWSGCNPVPPECLLLPSFLPFSPVYIPLAYLYGKKFVAPITDLVILLREELYIQPYGEVDWTKARNSCLKIRENPSGDFQSTYHQICKGAWTLTVKDQGWQVSDCTAEALKTLLLLSQMPADIVGDTIEVEQLYEAVDFLLTLQSENGGFSAWEPATSPQWMEMFNPTETFGGVMVETEYVDCTASVIQALASFSHLHPEYRGKEIEMSVAKAAHYVENAQMADGSWYGNWGICYTYAAYLVLVALAAVGKTHRNSEVVCKGCDFLLSKQLKSGGWGESYLSCRNSEYTPLDGNRSNLVQTAWTMVGLIRAGQEITGASLKTSMLHYASHRNIFPLWALGEYRKHVLLPKQNT
ncbi:lupeol synthase isoform X4 [Populus alba x Populus x berolinensis]|nr:lupeol synthase isoform X4 [Populus alba x Populus x berolinensis]